MTGNRFIFNSKFERVFERDQTLVDELTIWLRIFTVHSQDGMKNNHNATVF